MVESRSPHHHAVKDAECTCPAWRASETRHCPDDGITDEDRACQAARTCIRYCCGPARL